MTYPRHRDQARNTAPERSERLFSQENLWYFKIREGDDVGPFRYRSEAESNLGNFMEQLRLQLKQIC